MEKIFSELNREQLRQLIEDAVESAVQKSNQSNVNDGPTFISVTEACEILRVGRTTLHKYVKNDQLTKYKVEGKTLYMLEEVHELIINSKKKPNE